MGTKKAVESEVVQGREEEWRFDEEGLEASWCNRKCWNKSGRKRRDSCDGKRQEDESRNAEDDGDNSSGSDRPQHEIAIRHPERSLSADQRGWEAREEWGALREFVEFATRNGPTAECELGSRESAPNNHAAPTSILTSSMAAITIPNTVVAKIPSSVGSENSERCPPNTGERVLLGEGIGVVDREVAEGTVGESVAECEDRFVDVGVKVDGEVLESSADDRVELEERAGVPVALLDAILVDPIPACSLNTASIPLLPLSILPPVLPFATMLRSPASGAPIDPNSRGNKVIRAENERDACVIATIRPAKSVQRRVQLKVDGKQRTRTRAIS